MKNIILQIFFIVICVFNIYSGTMKQTNKYIKELNGMEEYLNNTVIPDYWHTIRKQEKSMKISTSFLTRFNFVYFHKIINPVNITNKSIFYFHYPSYEPNIKVMLGTALQNNINLSFSFGLNLEFDKEYNANFILANNYIFYMGLNTELGDFYINIGGPEWRKLTPFSYSTPGWNWLVYPFDRNSWDDIYTSYWKYKNLTKMEDVEKNERTEGAAASKGFRIDCWRLPFDLHFLIFWGKLDNSEIFYNKSSYLSYALIERYFEIFRVGTTFKNLHINKENSLSGEGFNENKSLFVEIYPKRIGKFYFEYGNSLLKYNNNSIKGNAYLIQWQKSIKKIILLKKVGLDFSFYHIEPDFVGEYTGVFHTYNPVPDFPLTYYGENPMGPANLNNNRNGINLSTKFESPVFLLSLLYNFSWTIKSTGSSISYPHSLNHSIWYTLYANIEPWCQNLSYYGDGKDHILVRYWEGASEIVYLKDTEKKKRYYDMFDINLGINISKIIESLQESYFTINFIQNTMQNKYKFVIAHSSKGTPVFWGNGIYLFIAQRIIEGLYLIGFQGQENWYSEYTTKRVEQKEKSYGIGFDYIFTSNSALFFKVKYYEFQDLTYRENYMRGIKYHFELKSQF